MDPVTKRALRVIVREHVKPYCVLAAAAAAVIAVVKLWATYPLTITALAALAAAAWVALLVWDSAVRQAKAELHRESLRKGNEE